jgi:hypothetical protein
LPCVAVRRGIGHSDHEFEGTEKSESTKAFHVRFSPALTTADAGVAALPAATLAKGEGVRSGDADRDILEKTKLVFPVRIRRGENSSL